MASFTVSATEHGAYEKTLTASTVDTVTCSGDWPGVEVLNEGTVGIYVTVNDVAPTVGGAGTWYVPPSSARVLPAGDQSGTTVRLISTGTPKYSVSEAV